MVIARRLRERQLEKARQEGYRQGLEEARREGFEEGRKKGFQERGAQWRAWVERMREAEKEGREFNEPMPSERDNGRP